MADQKFRSQSRDPGMSQASPSSGGRERFTQRSEDPLAELARLIGQEDPFADFQNEPQARGRPAGNGYDPRNGNSRGHPDDEFDDRGAYARDPEPLRVRRPTEPDPRYAEQAPARNGNGRGAPYAYGGRREEPTIARAPHRAPEPDYGYEAEDEADYPPQPAARRQAPHQAEYAPEHDDEYDDPRYARAPRGNGYADPRQAHDPRYDHEDAAGYESEYEEQYADEYDEEGYDQPARNPKRWLYAGAAAAVGLLVVGGAGYYAYHKLFGKHSGGAVATIRPSESPNKVPPQASAQPSPEGGGQKLIYDRLDSPKQGERIVSREEQPADVGAGGRVAMAPQPDPTPMPAPASGRMVMAPTGGTATAFAPIPAPAQNVPPAISAPQPGPVATATPPGEPRRVRTTTVRADGTIVEGPRSAARPTNQPLALSPQQAPADDDPEVQAPVAASRTAALAPRATQPAQSQPAWGNTQPAAQQTSNYVPAGSYVVQVASQKTEVDARTSWQQLQAKYSNVFGNYQASIKRVDLGDRGTFYRAMLGPFANRDQAYEMCQNLKAAGGECIVQRN